MCTMDESEQTYDFPMNILDSSTQITKINKRQLLHKEVPEVPRKISKTDLVVANEIKKISSDKTGHQSLLKLKKQIQNLIDFQSTRIVLIEIPTTDFSKHKQIKQNFQLITLDGEGIPELMLCKKCKQVRARGLMTATPIVRHLKQHEQEEMASKIVPKKKANNENNGILYARSLTHAMKNSVSIPNDAQECGANLNRDIRLAIEKTVLSQGDPEPQLRLYKNLKWNLWDRIDIEKSERKKKQLYKDLKSLELIFRHANDTRREKIPEVDIRKSPQLAFVEPENRQGPHSKENVVPAHIPDASNTSASIIFPAQEIIDVDGTENLSIATV